MKLPKDLFTSLLTTAILIGQTLLAQSEEETQLAETFEGVWQASFPESGQKAYLILKGNQVASYFFDLTADNLVHSATWTLDSVITPKAIISGSLGDNFEIFRGAVSYQVNWVRQDGTQVSGTAISVPDSQVGKLSVPPDEAGRRNTTLTAAEGFFGTWEIQNKEGLPFYIIVEDNRTAGCSFPFSSYGTRGLRGRWVKRGDELHINWDSGHFSILKELPDKYESIFYNPGEALNDENAGQTTIAARVDFRAPGIWATEYRETKPTYATSISAFRKRSNARSFYRGKWDVVDQDGGIKETIDFGRFQDVDSNREDGVDGSWRISADWAYITWEDGLRAVAQPIDDAFAISIFLPDQALDGTP
ncbi:MAG: hypothetical protein AAF212_12915, partial [Verrucomicrobiota bacterium]